MLRQTQRICRLKLIPKRLGNFTEVAGVGGDKNPPKVRNDSISLVFEKIVSNESRKKMGILVSESKWNENGNSSH